MATIPNVCLVRETSSPRVYFVCGGTKMWIPDPTEFAAVGFRWDKVSTVPDASLINFVDRPFLPPAPIKASDVFLAPLKDCSNWRSILPWNYGRWFPNCQALESLTARNVLVAGWLSKDPEVNLRTVGCEDVHYNLTLDPGFVERMYGPGGLSTLLDGRFYKGNLAGDSEAPATVQMPQLPTEDRSEIDGKSKGVTFNSFILPGNDDDIHGELNAWHETNTTADSGQRPIFWPHHFIGRGPAPQGWTQVPVDGWPPPDLDPGGKPVYTKDSPWFPWDIYAPGGDRLHAGDYVLMRGPIWQDVRHGDGASPETSAWHAGATLGHEGWVEMHPIDWIVRLQARPMGVRKTVGRVAWATFPGQDATAGEPTEIWPGFAPSTITNHLSVRGVQEVIDGRCSDMGTVMPGARWESFEDHVVVSARVTGTAARQG